MLPGWPQPMEVPEAVPSPELAKALDETLPKEAPKLTIEERQKLLMELLQQDGGLEQLKEWPQELALKFKRMLMVHHHIFSLDKNEIGCTVTAEYIIELMDDEPFKEQFQWIAPPLLEEVRENLQDMLDEGAIRLYKSPWCNAIVLVWKKDWTLRFCIDFQKLNSRTKKDSFPLTLHAGDHGVHGRSPILFQYGSEIWVLASMNVRKVPAVYRLHLGKPRHVGFPPDAVRVVQCTRYIPEAHAELPGTVKSHLCPGVPGQRDSVFKDGRGPSLPVTKPCSSTSMSMDWSWNLRNVVSSVSR